MLANVDMYGRRWREMRYLTSIGGCTIVTFMLKGAISYANACYRVSQKCSKSLRREGMNEHHRTLREHDHWRIWLITREFPYALSVQ